MELPILKPASPDGHARLQGGGAAGAPPTPRLTRRSFLRRGTAAAGGLAALGAAVSPLAELRNRDTDFFRNIFQKHYKEMSPEDMDAVLARIKRDVERRYGVTANVRDVRPMDGVEFVYALNLSRCNGNRRCVHACVAENNQSRSPEMQYIRVIEMPLGTLDLEQGNHYFDGVPAAQVERDGAKALSTSPGPAGNEQTVPKPGHFYLPVQCHQCASAPCVKVCPVGATWTEPDGITVVDYDWCIGCRYCEAACPYWARRFNFTEPSIPPDQLNPEMSYLSNRPRSQGVMEKCTFCLHRTREGRMPACLEACPTGARKFGNVLDPNSEVSQILRTKRVFVLKEDAGTMPRFFYYFDERHPRARSPVVDGSRDAGGGEGAAA
jgi:Fe-S-cluster-containing dehydrogenase component